MMREASASRPSLRVTFPLCLLEHTCKKRDLGRRENARIVDLAIDRHVRLPFRDYYTHILAGKNSETISEDFMEPFAQRNV